LLGALNDVWAVARQRLLDAPSLDLRKP